MELTASKPFFVSLELPFSVNFGETVTVTPLVFYFGSRSRVNVCVVILNITIVYSANSSSTEGLGNL